MDRHKVIVEYAATIQPYASAARTLRAEIESLNASIVRSRAVSAEAMQGVTRDFNQNLKAMRNWSTESVAMDSAAVQLGKSIERNQLSMSRQKDLLKEYRAGIVGARGAISELAKEQVRMSRSQVNFWEDANGKRMAAVSTPQGINFKAQATQIAVARQEMQIYNRLLMQNAEATINWGKNTQWAGRQIMVGMTIPLLMMGAAAKNVFLDVDKELTRLGKVYGSTIAGSSQAVIDQVKENVKNLGGELARDWGVSMKDTVGLAAEVAATGKEGEDLLVSTREAMRLSVLGEVDRQEALKATLSIQTAFNLSNQELVESINLLNAVENQTSTTLEDLSTAIPKAGPVVKALGGDIGDLAVMMVAMKEGGIAAGEGANAIKSGLASLINPTNRAKEAAKDLGVDLAGIVEGNKGQLMPTLLDFQAALQNLDEFSRAQLIEKIFGKYQFARISALFDNLNKEGSQSIQAMELAGASATTLAQQAQKEIDAMANSASGRWNRAVQDFKAQMIPVGEAITVVFTAGLNAVNKILDVFNNLPGPIKSVLGAIAGIAALVGPILMIAGIFGNFVGQMMKGMAFLRGKKYGMFDMLTTDIVAANAATKELVNAQFNEKASLLEINAVMEKQIAILNELAESHLRAAQASTTAAQTMTPPPVVPGTGTPSALNFPAPRQVGGREVRRGGEARSGDVGASAASSFLMTDQAAAAAMVAGLSEKSVAGEMTRMVTGEEAKAANEVGKAMGEITTRIVAEGAEIDPEQVHRELQSRFGQGSEQQRRMAQVAAAGLFKSMEIDPSDPEIKRMIESIPDLSRDGTGAAARMGAMGARAAGAAAPGLPGSYDYSHVNAHANQGRMTGNEPTNWAQIWTPTEANFAASSTNMTSADIAQNLTNTGGLTVATWAALEKAARTETQSRSSQPSVLRAADVGKSSPAGKFVAQLEGEQLKAWQAFVKTTQEGTISVQALEESLNRLAQSGLSVSDVATLTAEQEVEIARERVKTSKEAVAVAKAEKRAAYEAQRAHQETSKAAAAAAAQTQKFVGKASVINPRVKTEIARMISDGTSEGMSQAVQRIQQRIGAITTSSGALKSGQSMAELNALKAAAAKFEAAAVKLAAAEQAAKTASGVNMEAAKQNLIAAERDLVASKSQLTAAERQIVAANIEIAANEIEAAGAFPDKTPVPYAPGVVPGTGPGSPKPAPGGRMAAWAAGPGGGTMALGGAAMGAAMISGNEAAMTFGSMAMAAGMVTQAFGPLKTAIGQMAVRIGGAGGGITGALSASKAGLLRFAAPLMAGGPVTLALAGLAAAGTIAYLAWKKHKEQQEAWDRGGESRSELTGVQMGDRNRFRDPNLGDSSIKPNEDAAFRKEMSENEGYKAIGDDVDKVGGTFRKVALMERQYQANLRVIRNTYEGEELAREENRLKQVFQLLSEEKGLAKEWAAAKGASGESMVDAALKKWQDRKAVEAANPNGPQTYQTWTPDINWDTGKLNNSPLDAFTQTAAAARQELQGLQQDLAMGFKEAALSAEDSTDLIANIIPVADEWRQISLAGAGDFASMRDKMKEGLPDWLGPSIDNAETMDQAILNIIGRMNLIPREVVVQMNLVQGANETPEEFTARQAQAQMNYVVNKAKIGEYAADAVKKIGTAEKAAFNADAAGAAFDKRIEGIEAAEKAADRAHKREQERRKDQQDALREVIDGKQKEIDAIQKNIEKINEAADARKKELEKAKDLADFNRDQERSQINYYDAIARGDFVGAANIRSEMEQASADQQYQQAGDQIDSERDAKVKKEEGKIDAVNKEIEALNVRIEAIQKAGELSDRAYEREKERRADRLEALRKDKDAHIKAEEAKFKAAQDAEEKKRKMAIDSFNAEIARIEAMAGSNRMNRAQVAAATKAAYDDVNKYLGYDAEALTKASSDMANSIINAYGDALAGIGVAPKKPLGFFDQQGNYRLPGGSIPKNHDGTYVSQDHTTGKFGNRSDEVTRTLQVGEYVIRKEAVNKFGRGTFDSLNKMRMPSKMHTGGSVIPSRPAAMAGISAARGYAFRDIMNDFKANVIPGEMARVQASMGPFPSATQGGGGANWGGVDIGSASPKAQSAMSRAMNDFTNLVGMCLQEVRQWYGIPAKYGSAAEAWGGAKTKHRDTNPKLGAPVFWTGGSRGFGHIAMYMGKGMVRSTDRPTGKINNVPMSSFGGALNYAGWTEDLNGVAIQLRKGAEIKKDNVLANLHARETVLTAGLSESLRRGINGLSDVPAIIDRGAGGGTVFNEGERNIYVTVNALPGMDVDDLANTLSERVARAEQRIGG